MGLSAVAVPPPLSSSSRSPGGLGGAQRRPRSLQQGEEGDDDGELRLGTTRHNTTAGEDNSNIFGTYQRGCTVSNDPISDDDHQVIPQLALCNLTSYVCPSASGSAAGPVPVQIAYDYELHFNPSANLARILVYYEELSLEHLATAMGLRNCTPSYSISSSSSSSTTTTSSVPSANEGKRRHLLAFPNYARAMLNGISLYPRDRTDPLHSNCLVTVSDVGTGTESGSVCLPIQGALTVYTTRNADGSDLSDAQTESLRSLVLKEIQRGMDGDLYVTRMNILKMSYVGNRTQLEASSSVQASKGTSGSGGRGMSSVMISVISIVALLAVIGLVFILLVVRRRKPRRGRRGGEDEESTIPPDWHVPANLGLGTPAQGALAVRDSLALKPQRYSAWPGDDCTADVTAYSSVTPPRTLLSPSGSGESPLRPPSQFTSRRSLTSFDSSMLGVDTVGSDLTLNDHEPPVARSQSLKRGQERYQQRASVSSGTRPNGTLYVEQLGSLGSTISYTDDIEIPDSGSERSARRALQMT
jgi:hypothetical protein